MRDREVVIHPSLGISSKGNNENKFIWLLANTYIVYYKVNGGREGRPIGAYELAKAVEELGAGEILLNCIDCDGQSHSLSFN